MTTGLVSFAHAAFVAIGGYASALTVMRLGLNSWVGLVAALLAAAVVAVIFGLILLRLKGTYFFIATTAFGELVTLIFIRFTNPFGGAAGLANIPVPTSITIPWGFTIVFESKIAFYYLIVAFNLVLLSIAYRLEKGRMGTIWTGIAQASDLCGSIGINVMLYKMIAFLVGSMMAAAAGAFQTHYLSHISPDSFGFLTLVNYLVFVMVGGSKKFVGPLIGAFLLTLFSEALRMYEQLALYETIIYGVALILSVMFFPDGLVSLPGKIFGWYRELNKRGGVSVPSASPNQSADIELSQP